MASSTSPTLSTRRDARRHRRQQLTATARIIDTHAHLTLEQFDADLDDVIARAAAAGVDGVICAGTNIESSRRSVVISERHPTVLATAGIHPHDSHPLSDDEIIALEELVRHPKVVAIGEIGLDFYRKYSPHDGQLVALGQQLDLAGRVGLPVVIHCRQAEAVMLPLLGEWTASTDPPPDGRRGVIHCFMADDDALCQYLEMGFMISLGGYVSYPGTVVAHEVIRHIPLDRLLVETDCPFLAPQRLRGRRNEPALVVDTVAVLAEIRGVSFDQIAAATTCNARRLFWREPFA